MLSKITPKQNKLGVYIHWPFCVSKCPYCDFNSHVKKDIDVEQWEFAYLSELRWMADIYRQNTQYPSVLHTVFFGGGTPSLMPVSIIERIMETIEDLFILHPKIEITVEANPSSSELDNLSAFKSIGVNRISFGAQSLNPKTLKFLGRAHDTRDIYKALDVAFGLFNQISADFIYGTPGQNIGGWEDELSKIAKFDLTHISTYQLTIEPGTQFYSRSKKGEKLTCDDDTVADLYDLTTNVLSSHGYEIYEISNYAKPNSQCQHNLLYWNAQDWLGIGPGAHGRFTMPENRRWHSQTRRSPDGWLSSVKKEQHGIEIQNEDYTSDFAKEIIIMGLRLTSGIVLPDWLIRKSDFINLNWLDEFEKDGFITFNKNHIRVTKNGRLHLNSIVSKLLN